jgi:hypothetical protein
VSPTVWTHGLTGTHPRWRPGSSLENAAAGIFERHGIRPDECSQEHRVGRFAFPDVMIAVECDGWHHRRPETAAKDVDRDAYLRRHGWTVLRVDDVNGPDTFSEQIARACRIITTLRSDRRFVQAVCGDRRLAAERASEEADQRSLEAARRKLESLSPEERSRYIDSVRRAAADAAELAGEAES